MQHSTEYKLVIHRENGNDIICHTNEQQLIVPGESDSAPLLKRKV